MHFGFTPDQLAMGESLRRLFAGVCPPDETRRIAEGGLAPPALADAIGASGALDVLVPEALGGLGLGRVDAVAVAMEAGRAIVPWPLSETLAARGAAACQWPQAPFPALRSEAFALAEGAGLRMDAQTPGAGDAPASATVPVSGRLLRLPWALQSRWLVALATGGPRAGPVGVLVDLEGGNVRREPRDALDLTGTLGAVVLDNAPAAMLPASAVRDASRDLSLLMAAEATGAAEASFERTVAYMKDRQQFGRPIGSFQALKHIAADDAIRIESMRVAVLYAAWAVDARSPDAAMAVAVAKSYVSGAARQVIDHAIQLHGGIAYTWEYGLHLYLRRILRCAASGGTAEAHREALASDLIDHPAPVHPAAAHQLEY